MIDEAYADVKPESFEWVIKEVIRLIKEKGE